MTAERQTRRILLGFVGLVRGRVRHDGPAMAAICSELDPILERSGWFAKAPFCTIHLIFRCAAEANPVIELRSPDLRNKELPATVQLSMRELQEPSPNGVAELQSRFLLETIKVLAVVADKYRLNPVSLET